MNPSYTGTVIAIFYSFTTKKIEIMVFRIKLTDTKLKIICWHVVLYSEFLRSSPTLTSSSISNQITVRTA